MRKFIPLLILAVMLLVSVSISLAQTDTTTTTEFNSNVTIFYVACENQGVVNLTGTMEANFDVFFQAFSGPGGTGTPLTNLRQASVDGTYTFSEAVAYTGGTIPAGGTGSVKVYIANESTPNTPGGDTFTVDDIQDGCNNPQNALSSSIDTGTGGTATTSSTSGGVRIRSPFGGYINSSVLVTPEPPVLIGARTSVNPERSSTPGVIFAECDSYLPAAAPGILYDNDNIVIFWSWYARTAAQAQDHIAKAQYDVKLNTAPLVEVGTSEIQQLGANYWVFYTANIGNLAPGQYGVSYRLTWSDVHFDGYDDYGPDTNNPSQSGTCTFTIQQNPNGSPAVYSNMYRADFP